MSKHQVDNYRYVRYATDQVEALERVFAECPKPTSLRRQPIQPSMAYCEPKQIKVWLQNLQDPEAVYCNFERKPGHFGARPREEQKAGKKVNITPASMAAGPRACVCGCTSGPSRVRWG